MKGTLTITKKTLHGLYRLYSSKNVFVVTARSNRKVLLEEQNNTRTLAVRLAKRMEQEKKFGIDWKIVDTTGPGKMPKFSLQGRRKPVWPLPFDSLPKDK